jgi:hypothetical protein
MITPSFSLTATERVLPKLALDFTTASLDPRVTFTRTGNTATVTNSSGVIVGVNADLPRFDFDPITLVCKGLLIEEARTNIIPVSQDLSSASWTKNNLTLGATTVSPDGTNNAYKIEETTASGTHNLTITAGVGSSQYAVSVFLKAAERTFALISLSATNVAVSVNLSTGVVSSANGSPSNLKSESYDDGWWLVSFTGTAVSGTNTHNIYASQDGVWANRSYVGEVGKGLYVWGHQIESGAFPTSYIPTEATAVTRNADVATMTGTNFSDWFNATEGTLFSRASRFANTATFSSIFQVDDGSDLNRINIEIRNTTGTVFGACGVAGINQAALGSAAVGTNTANLAFAYKQDSFAFSHNGTAVLTDTSGNLPTVNAALIGSRRASGASQFLNGHIQKIMYYPQRLINAEVQAITK